ncbi:MAG: threonylcarbamoyl-AMP synthase [Chromatiales bacterium]|nr:threonylcarbamoyl-AMP synthase [Chromatiales bacterium]
MAQYFEIHPENPQARLIQRAVEIVREGGIIAYPTDSSYALGCHIGDKQAADRIRRVRQVDDRHNMTLVCRDLSELGIYARVENRDYRLLKALTPGAYTFILHATREVPRRLFHPKRKTIGLRVPEHRIALALLAALNEPLLSSTLILPGEAMPLNDPYEIRDRLGAQIDLVIDGGACPAEPTSVVDLTGDAPAVLRVGRGDVSVLE